VAILRVIRSTNPEIIKVNLSDTTEKLEGEPKRDIILNAKDKA
jgi:hypothetical protein